MKIAICDDDALYRAQILDMVNDYNEQKNHVFAVSIYERPAMLLDAVERFGGYDIYILDILMPGMSGIELGVQLRQSDPDGKILYLTSSRDYAIESYDARAFSYLVKPVTKEKLFATLDDAMRNLINRKEKSLIVKTRENRVKLTMDHILYVELADRRVVYHTVDGSAVESNSIRTTFAEHIQELLTDGRFVLCGQGIAVNLYHVTKASNETLFFRNGSKLYIGKRAGRDLVSVWSDFWLYGEGNK